ncbi:MAG: zf-TFIIB domain-containing protein [Chloroflexota bacterium]
MAVYTCPKRGVQMREIRRSGVVIARCIECGGVFLDRGELEHLVEGEREFYGQEPRTEARQPGRERSRDDYDDWDDDRDDRRGGRRRDRRRSFFEELLDFDLG